MALRYDRRMSARSGRVEHLFIVRIWHEPGPGGHAPWRGSVEHVGSKERKYFTSLVALTDFLETKVGGTAPVEVEPT